MRNPLQWPIWSRILQFNSNILAFMIWPVGLIFSKLSLVGRKETLQVDEEQQVSVSEEETAIDLASDFLS